MDDQLAFSPSTELRDLIASKQVSPVEVTELYFSRIDRIDSKLNSYLTLARNEAMAGARAAEQAVVRGDTLGPLHGLPISLKDLEMTRGIRTTSGSLAYKDRVPNEDSIVVERVRGAGAILLGKTNTPEFGLLGMTENRLGDHCRNPWNTDRTTGSDGGGSVRIPSSFCGVYGIKPTQGRVPRYSGAAPALANHLGQSGPITRTVGDSAMLLQVMAGSDPRDASALRKTPPDFVAALERDIKGLRIGWSRDYGYAAVDPEVVEVTSKAAQVFGELGCAVTDSDLALDSPFDTFWTLFSAGAYASNRILLENQSDLLTEYARECFENGAAVTGADYAGALGNMDRLKAQFADIFDSVDLLWSPTMAVPPLEVGQRLASIAGREVHPFWGYLPFTYPINLIGHPAASVPCGFSADGLPIGLHIVGRPGDEETVIAASAAFERARPWIGHRPPVS